MSLSGELFDLVASKEISREDLEAAALFTLDAVASVVAGTRTPQGEILVAWGRRIGACGENAARDAGRRAFLLGGLTHILEVDDLHRESVVHPGCITIPAVWAAAESGLGESSGREFLSAILWGFEATTRVGMAAGPAHYRIFHNTATCGPFGSAMAVARLIGLARAQAVDALGNAGTQAAGLWQFLDTGAMSKHLHAGRAAEAGLVAAELAALGFTGAPEILEGARGFFAALCPDAEPARLIADPQAPWQLRQTSIKPWPSCRHTHPAIDAAQEIRQALAGDGRKADEIASIEVETYGAALALCDRAEPKTVYDAKFSLQHTVAAALCRDRVDFAAFDEEARCECAKLRGRVKVAETPSFEGAYPAHWGARVSARLENGRVVSAERGDAMGDPEMPLSSEQMVDKARGLLDFGRYPRSEALIEGILALADGGPLPRLAI
ncbi:MAG: MmgE/PrpD family protein [Hyphomicrobiales bacterium]|nr:MmgE/PrpD family protein [Hyphomicrobiales bacterium]